MTYPYISDVVKHKQWSSLFKIVGYTTLVNGEWTKVLLKKIGNEKYFQIELSVFKENFIRYEI